jgi:hypothetical protein
MSLIGKRAGRIAVASNVKDGTDYRFEFASSAGWQGYRAE